MSRLLLYIRTCRRLSVHQIWWRLRYMWRRKWIERYAGRRILACLLKEGGKIADFLLASTDKTGHGHWEAECSGVTVAGMEEYFILQGRSYYRGDLNALLRNEFTFLNKTICFGERVDWSREELDVGTRLWKLTINYHEYLVDVARAWRRDAEVTGATSSSVWGEWLEQHVREWMR